MRRPNNVCDTAKTDSISLIRTLQLPISPSRISHAKAGENSRSSSVAAAVPPQQWTTYIAPCLPTHNKQQQIAHLVVQTSSTIPTSRHTSFLACISPSSRLRQTKCDTMQPTLQGPTTACFPSMQSNHYLVYDRNARFTAACKSGGKNALIVGKRGCQTSVYRRSTAWNTQKNNIDGLAAAAVE
jgi:hypothetical protein